MRIVLVLVALHGKAQRLFTKGYWQHKGDTVKSNPNQVVLVHALVAASWFD
jgi:hypothetical protein